MSGIHICEQTTVFDQAVDQIRIASEQRGDVHHVSRSRSSRGCKQSIKKWRRPLVAPLFVIRTCILVKLDLSLQVCIVQDRDGYQRHAMS